MPRRNLPTRTRKVPKPFYQRYWEHDMDTAPAIVLVLKREGENFKIKHPDGRTLWTHLHNLGRAA